MRVKLKMTEFKYWTCSINFFPTLFYCRIF